MTNSYYIDVRHAGLNKFRRVTGRDSYTVQEKAAAQAAQWNAIWEKQQRRENLVKDKTQKRELAIQRTKELQQVLSDLEQVLLVATQASHKLDWHDLFDKVDLDREKPRVPTIKATPAEPQPNDHAYEPKYGFLDRFIESWAARKREEAKARFKTGHAQWVETVALYKKQFEDAQKKYAIDLKIWEEKKLAQAEQHKKIEAQQALYMSKDEGAVEDYCDMVLANSKYPIDFDKNCDFLYQPQNGLLVVDYFLPNQEVMPSIKELKYVVSRDELNEVPIAEATKTKLYDVFLYQVTLRTLYELFEADQANAITSIVLNGWVSYIDKATGHETKSCILSVQTTKDVYLALNLDNVDAKECFRQLRGIGSPKLHNLTPVAPIVVINKEDKRFIPAYEVADSLDA